jgi:hypothetical protein
LMTRIYREIQAPFILADRGSRPVRQARPLRDKIAGLSPMTIDIFNEGEGEK